MIGHRGLDTVLGRRRRRAPDVHASCGPVGRRRVPTSPSSAAWRTTAGRCWSSSGTTCRRRWSGSTPTAARHVLLGSAGPGHRPRAGGPRPDPRGRPGRRSTGWRSRAWSTCRPADGPHPLVVHPHGGPVGAYQDGWIGRDPHTDDARRARVRRAPARTRAAAPAGVRSSRRRCCGDMGGLDVSDILTGVDAPRRRRRRGPRADRHRRAELRRLPRLLDAGGVRRLQGVGGPVALHRLALLPPDHQHPGVRRALPRRRRVGRPGRST